MRQRKKRPDPSRSSENNSEGNCKKQSSKFCSVLVQVLVLLVFGVILPLCFVHQNKQPNLEKYIGDFPRTLQKDILSTIRFHSFDRFFNQTTVQSDHIGKRLVQTEQLTAFYPVVMVPGFTSSGLEIWKGRKCSEASYYFRQRIWGTAKMFQQFMLNQKCWLEHIMLNGTTGLDPDGIKLRSSQGLDAADYVVGGFWVWGKIIENLAELGYDSNSMYMAAYDWRLRPQMMEERDFFFTKLKFMIESAVATSHGRKVVVLAHSYAATVVHFFCQWVESKNGGNMGKKWVDKHIHAFAPIAGPFLGLPKAASALISGEMKDTADLGLLVKILPYFFGASARAALARSWASVSTMLPAGGDRIWGGIGEPAPDDINSVKIQHLLDPHLSANLLEPNPNRSFSNSRLIKFTDRSHSDITAAEIPEFLAKLDPPVFQKLNSQQSFGFAENPSDPKYDSPRYWNSPLESSLPNAPHMKIFCLYGVSKAVERGYNYHQNAEENSTLSFLMNMEDDINSTHIKAGVRYVDGDGTVPLISLGYMCARGWRTKKYNPSQMKVIIREYKHSPVSMFNDMRGGPNSADHVDIMGNSAMIEDILRIAGNSPKSLESDIIYSQIHKIADNVDEYDKAK